MDTSIRMPRTVPLLGLTLLLLAAATVSGCRATLTPNQRQELETRVVAAPLEDVFAAVRDTVINAGYEIIESDYRGGMLGFQRDVQVYSPGAAAGMSIFLAPAGDIYLHDYGWIFIDTLFWPLSGLWAAPRNYATARDSVVNERGNVSFKELAARSVRFRISLHGVEWDTEHYPYTIRRLHEEVERQLLLQDTGPLSRSPP